MPAKCLFVVPNPSGFVCCYGNSILGHCTTRITKTQGGTLKAGLNPAFSHNMRREWTKKEEEYLVKRYCKQPVEKTAATLGRTICSVKGKARKLGLNIYVGEYIYAKTLAKCFGHDVSVVLRWINKLGLPAKEVKVANVTRYQIDPGKFWVWAKEHQKEIHWANYEPLSLVPEPEWLDEVRKTYTKPNHHRPISNWDIAQTQRMLHHGATFHEIGMALGRTTDGAKHLARTYGL